ncbi:hypothetical protein PT974_00029 [Cladobotryum mycophilum]|uniref:Terpene synthase n=1 Tax=Cladobotryum mycophilum TaxID=491253 RepID=A0ABR0SZX5_9HYPO
MFRNHNRHTFFQNGRSHRIVRIQAPSSTLGKERIEIKLKKHDILMRLDIPSYRATERQKIIVEPGRVQNGPAKSSSRVLQAHTRFKMMLQPSVTYDRSFHELCAAEVNAISVFFPNLQSEKIQICFAAWLGFVCVMDDVLETLPPWDGEKALAHSAGILQSYFTGAEKGTVTPSGRIPHLTLTLRHHCEHHLPRATACALFKAALVVFQAHKDEIRFLSGQIPNSLSNYMAIRSKTIALNPFFEVIKHEFLPAKWRSNSAWNKLQLEVSRAAGLQNDLIGLEKDLEKNEEMNAVIIMMRAHDSNLKVLDEKLYSNCISLVNKEHNDSVARSLGCVAKIQQSAKGELPDSVAEVVRHIVSLGETHLKWCASAKRYRIACE